MTLNFLNFNCCFLNLFGVHLKETRKKSDKYIRKYFEKSKVLFFFDTPVVLLVLVVKNKVQEICLHNSLFKIMSIYFSSAREF